MRYLTLAEALTIAEAVTGIDTRTLRNATRLELLDSALHAPQASFGDTEFYPKFVDKAAVLVVRITRNHPLPDGNKRLAWQSLTMFCALNDHELDVPPNEAVSTMLAIAAGELDEVAVAAWLTDQLHANTR
ncbi:MAG: type II toxin-antitoxin system death-on-curing family toxin [bacterium]|nr:type II toxin-antitoxin system death-on-curing family toxin [bacterium]